VVGAQGQYCEQAWLTLGVSMARKARKLVSDERRTRASRSQKRHFFDHFLDFFHFAILISITPFDILSI